MLHAVRPPGSNRLLVPGNFLERRRKGPDLPLGALAHETSHAPASTEAALELVVQPNAAGAADAVERDNLRRPPRRARVESDLSQPGRVTLEKRDNVVPSLDGLQCPAKAQVITPVGLREK